MMDPVEHKRLLEDLSHICEVAGIQPKFLSESMTVHCGASEVDWVKHFRQLQSSGLPGMVLESVGSPDVRCQAIAAALIRNFIDARVISLNRLLDALDERSVPMPTVLLIPNLFVTGAGKGLAPWKVQMVYDMLLQRAVYGKPTVAYIERMEGLQAEYGKIFADHLRQYRIVKGVA